MTDLSIADKNLKRCFRGDKCKHPNGPYLPKSQFSKAHNTPDHLMLECNYCRGKKWIDRDKETALRLLAMKRVAETVGQYTSGAVLHGERNRARKHHTVYEFSLYDWRYCLSYFNYCCAYCGKRPEPGEYLHHEHYIAVSAGGNYVPDNIIPACFHCNVSKGAQNAHEWIVANFSVKAYAIEHRILEYFQHIRLINRA